MPNLYATLNFYALDRRVGGSSHPDPVNTLSAHQRTLMLEDLEEASQRIDTWCGRHFYPLRATYSYDHQGGKQLELGDHDLVEVEEILTANGQATIDLDDILLYTGDDHNFEVKDRIRIKNESGEVFYVGDSTQESTFVTGVWNYHLMWSQAWLSSADTVKVTQTAGAATLAVNAVSGVNGAGRAPRFQIGQLLQIDDEWEYVAGIDEATNIMTVARAQNGTVAAEHTDGTAIYIYRPMRDIAKACRIITDFFRVLPQTHATGKMQSISGAQIVNMDIPVAAQQLLEPYRRILMGHGTNEDRYMDDMYNLRPIGGRY